MGAFTDEAHRHRGTWNYHKPGTVECRGWATSSTFEKRASASGVSSVRSERPKTVFFMDAARSNGNS